MKENDVNIWSNELSGEILDQLLNSSRRGKLLDTYEYFESDQSKEIFQRWIYCNLTSTKDRTLEDIFVLIRKSKLVQEEINNLCLRVMGGRYRYFTKLACLDYVLSMHRSLSPEFFKSVSILAIEHTKNPIVLFQGTLNLCMSDVEKYYRQLTEQLAAADYPTLFYRLANQLWLFPEKSRELLAELLLSVLAKKEFSDGVKRELLDRIKGIRPINPSIAAFCNFLILCHENRHRKNARSLRSMVLGRG